jgi:hypothetical protein
MQHRITLFIILAVGIISTAQLTSLLLTVSPYTASSQSLWAFFITLYFSFTSIFSLVWYWVKRTFGKLKHTVSFFACIRQVALVGLVLILAFFFSSLEIFQVWDIIPLVIAAVLIEFFFQADKKPHATLEYEAE